MAEELNLEKMNASGNRILARHINLTKNLEKSVFDMSPSMAVYLASHHAVNTVGYSCCAVLDFKEKFDANLLLDSYLKFVEGNPSVQVVWDIEHGVNLWRRCTEDELEAELLRIKAFAQLRLPLTVLMSTYEVHNSSRLPFTIGISDDSRAVICLKHHFSDGVTGLFWADRILQCMNDLKGVDPRRTSFEPVFFKGAFFRLSFWAHRLKWLLLSPLNAMCCAFLMFKSRDYKLSRFVFSENARIGPKDPYYVHITTLDKGRSLQLFSTIRQKKIKLASYISSLVVLVLKEMKVTKTGALILITSFLKPFLTNDRFAILPYNSISHVIVDIRRSGVRFIDWVSRYQIFAQYGHTLLFLFQLANRDLKKLDERLRQEEQAKRGSLDAGLSTPTISITNLGALSGPNIDLLCSDLDFYLLTPSPSLFIYSYGGRIKIAKIARLEEPDLFDRFAHELDRTLQFKPA